MVSSGKTESEEGSSIIEEFLWLKLCKDFFHLPKESFVCSVYIPSANSSRERKLNVDHLTPLNEQILSTGHRVILCYVGTLIVELQTSLIL